MGQARGHLFSMAVLLYLLLFSGRAVAEEIKLPDFSPDKCRVQAKSKMQDIRDVLSKLESKEFKAPADFNRPAFKQIRSAALPGAGAPQPESLCDSGYYWMGGEAWTSDTDGVRTVWGAGGNLYFSDVADPENIVEMWWGDLPLRIRLHNGFAYVYAYYYTYVFDVSHPTDPVFLNYAPGFVHGFLDAIPSPDDNYLLLVDWDDGGIDVWDIAAFDYKWRSGNRNGGMYITACIPEDEHNMGKTLILGDFYAPVFDFYDISDLSCSPPSFTGSISDMNFNTALLFYKYPYFYGAYMPWQWYNGFIIGGNETNFSSVSVYDLPDAGNPAESFLLQTYSDSFDIVSIKDAGDKVMVADLQNRVALFDYQFTDLIKEEYYGLPSDAARDRVIFDAGYSSSSGGVAANGVLGARFFRTDLAETSHYATGGYANDIVAGGDYLYVPSGNAGLAIIYNRDPTNPMTKSFLEPNAHFSEVRFTAVSQDENKCYVSDGTTSVWVVDISDKNNPAVSTGAPYTAEADVSSLTMAGQYLVVGTNSSLELVDVTTTPSAPILLESRSIPGGCSSVRDFTHPSYPGQVFIGAVSSDTFYIYRYTGGNLVDMGLLGGFYGLYGLAIAGQVAYAIDWNATIYPIRMFSLLNPTTSGTTPLTIGYSYGRTYIAKISDSWLAASGDYRLGGAPAVFLVDIETDPLAPQLLPANQNGVFPFNSLTGLTASNGYVYYATDYFGAGAFSLQPDYDMPYTV